MKNHSGTKLIEIGVKNPKQLFDARDPAPFRERDLDEDLVTYILSSAQEYSLGTPLKLRVHISEASPSVPECESIAESIHNHFSYEADLAKGQLKKLFRNGRTFSLLGLTTLFFCFLLSNYIELHYDFDVKPFVREGLLISGWVAMWRPIEVFLYDWFPILEKKRYLKKLSEVDIEVNEHKFLNVR